jgi:hypothetical protein
MANMIAHFVVNICLEIMLAEGDDGMTRGRESFSFIFRGNRKDTSAIKLSIALEGSAPRYLSHKKNSWDVS